MNKDVERYKEGVSLYTNSPKHIAGFKTEYPAIKTGKASINFKVKDVVPEAALKRVIEHAVEHSK